MTTRHRGALTTRLDDDEKATLTNNEGQAGYGPQSFTIINESGLWSLVLTSRKPIARRFKRATVARYVCDSSAVTRWMGTLATVATVMACRDVGKGVDSTGPLCSGADRRVSALFTPLACLPAGWTTTSGLS